MVSLVCCCCLATGKNRSEFFNWTTVTTHWHIHADSSTRAKNLSDSLTLRWDDVNPLKLAIWLRLWRHFRIHLCQCSMEWQGTNTTAGHRVLQSSRAAFPEQKFSPEIFNCKNYGLNLAQIHCILCQLAAAAGCIVYFHSWLVVVEKMWTGDSCWTQIWRTTFNGNWLKTTRVDQHHKSHSGSNQKTSQWLNWLDALLRCQQKQGLGAALQTSVSFA